MSLHQINVEWKHVKSYATEAALNKRIEQDKGMYPEHDDRFIVLLTQGVSSTDMDRVQECLFSELAHIAKEAR